MKRLHKLLTLILTICIAMSMLIGFAPANAVADTTAADSEVFDLPDIVDSVEAKENDYIGRVEAEEKDLYTFVFANGDGTNTMKVYSHPVKYIADDGSVRDISLDVEAKTGGGFVTADHEIVTTFDSKLTEGISLEYNDVEIKLVPELSSGIEPTAILSSDSKAVTYEMNDITSFVYKLTYAGFKEDIVVEKYTGQTEYEFTLFTNGLTLCEEYGSYYLADPEGNIKATIGDIIVFTADERNNTMGSMTYETVRADQEYILTIHLDADYLADEATVYPIRIDPTIEINYDNDGAGAIEDVTINENVTFGGTSGSLYIGRHPAGSLSRVLMRFPKLSLSGIYATQISSASVEIRDLMCQGSENFTIECCTYNKSAPAWSESGTTSWSSVGSSYLGDVLDSHLISYGRGNVSGDSQRYSFNILNAARAWADGTQSPAKGLVFKADSAFENQTGDAIKTWYKTFSSYNRAENYKPSLSIVYTPIYEYSYVENAPIQYTYHTSLYLIAGETITLSTKKATSYANVDTVLNLFYTSNPTASNSWVNDNYNETSYSQLTVTIPTTGSYTLMVRCNDSSIGYCNVYKNASLLQENAQLGGYKFSCQKKTGTQNFFTANSVGVDTVLYVMDSSDRVIAYNDDYSYYKEGETEGDFSWGRHSRVHKNMTTQPSYLFVAGYFASEEGTTDIYANCTDGYTHTGDFPNLKAIDSIKAESAPAYTYNCIAWSGGIAHRWINPYNASKTNQRNLSYMDPWYDEDPVKAFDNFYGNNPQRYVGATTYVPTDDATNAIIDVYYLNNEWTHASVRKPGNDMPHGYAWESKLGANQRIFHARNSLEGGIYGSIMRHYTIPTATRSSAPISNITLDESIKMGLTVENVVLLSNNELAVLQTKKRTISSKLMQEFDEAYIAWVTAINENDELSTVNNNTFFVQMNEFDALSDLIQNNESLVYAVIDLYLQSQDVFTRTLFEATVVSLNSKTIALAHQVREANNAISLQSMKKDVYVAPSFEANVMTFIKQLLNNPSMYFGDGNVIDNVSLLSETKSIDASSEGNTNMLTENESVAISVDADLNDFSDDEESKFEVYFVDWKKATSHLSSTQAFLRTDEFVNLARLIGSDLKYKKLLIVKCCKASEDRLLYELLVNELIMRDSVEAQLLIDDIGYKQTLEMVINLPKEFMQ